MPFPSHDLSPLGLGPLSGGTPPSPHTTVVSLALVRPADPCLPLSPAADHSGREVSGAAAGGGAEPAAW